MCLTKLDWHPGGCINSSGALQVIFNNIQRKRALISQSADASPQGQNAPSYISVKWWEMVLPRLGRCSSPFSFFRMGWPSCCRVSLMCREGGFCCFWRVRAGAGGTGCAQSRALRWGQKPSPIAPGPAPDRSRPVGLRTGWTHAKNYHQKVKPFLWD